MTSDHFKAIRTAVVLFPLVAIVSLVVLSRGFSFDPRNAYD